MQTQLEKLRAVVRGLTELQEVTERHRGICFFEAYYRNYEKYKMFYLEAGKLLKEKVVENLELEIPELSTEEITTLVKKGEDNAELGGYLSDIAEYSKKLGSNVQNVVTLCENAAKAETYLKAAHHEKSRAAALITKSDWNGAVEASQRCGEHSTNALFVLSGNQQAYKRDLTKNFKQVVEKLKLQNCELNDLARIRWLAKVWVTTDEETRYAFYDIPAGEFLSEKDAKNMIDYANEIYSMCSKLVEKVQDSQFKT